MEHFKKAAREPEADDVAVKATVATMLDDIRARGETAVAEYADKFDGRSGDFVLSDQKRQGSDCDRAGNGQGRHSIRP